MTSWKFVIKKVLIKNLDGIDLQVKNYIIKEDTHWL